MHTLPARDLLVMQSDENITLLDLFNGGQVAAKNKTLKLYINIEIEKKLPKIYAKFANHHVYVYKYSFARPIKKKSEILPW